MTYAASSRTNFGTPKSPAKLHRFSSLWPGLLAALGGLTIWRVQRPDKAADSAQALPKRLPDCDSS